MISSSDISSASSLKLRSLPPRGKVEPEDSAVVPNSGDQVELSAQEHQKTGMSAWKKVGLGALGVLSLTGAATAATGLVAQHAALCEVDAGTVGWQNGGLCVSPDLSKNVDGVYRTVRGQFHRGDAVEDLASNTNRVVTPDGKVDGTSEDGQFRVMTWNLHHGTSQNSDGARDQIDLQVKQINSKHADVVLLQEVPPWHVNTLVNDTGKVGYYTHTNGRQGDLVLVSPELQVTENSRVTLNHQINSKSDAGKVVDLSQGDEPRAAQFLTVTGSDTGGKSTGIFNTHLSTTGATAEQRRAEHQNLMTHVGRLEEGTDVFVGGGDFNTRDGREVVQSMRDQGYNVSGATIDWVVSEGLTPTSSVHADAHDAHGVRLSDHPYVVVDFAP